MLALAGAVALLVLIAVTVAVLATDSEGGSGNPTTAASQGTSPSTTALPPGTSTSSSTHNNTLPSRPSGENSTVSGSTVSGSTASSTTTSASSPPTTPLKVVVIDPGHQARPNLNPEPIGPGSSRTKAKVSSGTSGVVSGIPESELNLALGLKLRDALEARGIKVIMTRTTQEVDISNRERARLANEAKADLFIRLHADGNADPDVHGIHTLYPANIPGWTNDIAAISKQAAELIQRELIKATGARDRGLDERSDLTGFNWSDVPVVLPEVGYMTNPTEDRLLATDAYRDKIVHGLVQGILLFLGMG